MDIGGGYNKKVNLFTNVDSCFNNYPDRKYTGSRSE